MVFNLIGSIILDTFRLLYMTCKSHIISLLTILILRDSGIYICFLNDYNVISNIETSVNKLFSFGSILGVLNIYLYNYYV